MSKLIGLLLILPICCVALFFFVAGLKFAERLGKRISFFAPAFGYVFACSWLTFAVYFLDPAFAVKLGIFLFVMPLWLFALVLLSIRITDVLYDDLPPSERSSKSLEVFAIVSIGITLAISILWELAKLN